MEGLSLDDLLLEDCDDSLSAKPPFGRITEARKENWFHHYGCGAEIECSHEPPIRRLAMPDSFAGESD